MIVSLIRLIEMKRFFYIFVLILVILILACEEITTVNPVPVIKFKEYTLELGRDTTDLANLVFIGKLLFEFNDGDGADLSDAAVTYTTQDGITINGDTLYKIISTPFIKVDSQYIESNFDTINNYLIYDKDMNINKVGQNKTLKGEIEITRYFLYIPADTVRFEFYIIDRDGNISNTETTYDIGFR